MKQIIDFKKFLNEDVQEGEQPKVVYFLHPKFTYDTRVEEQGIALINLYFDNPLIYSTPEHRGGYLDFEDEVNIFVVLPHTDASMTPRAVRRTVHAFEKGAKIYYMHPKEYKLIRIDPNNVEFFQEKVMGKDEWREKVKSDNIENYFTKFVQK